MQLKLRRSQREAGIVSTNVVFCLDARADLSDLERSNLARYKLYDQVIYNSEASRRHLEKSEAALSGNSGGGNLKALMHVGLSKLRLNITVRGLERGQHIECKSLDELIAGENAIMEACTNLKTYLDVAATFDGSELVFEFAGGEPQVIAQAMRPEPILTPPLYELAATPIPPLAGAEPGPAMFTNGPTVNSQPSAEYHPTLNPVDELISRISSVTGLDERQSKLAAIGVAVALLVLLLAKCYA